jgi:hypothetical protein
MGGGDGVVSDETLAQRRIHDERGVGQAIVGALLKGCLDRGIEPVTGARAVQLRVEGGRVTGAEIEQDGEIYEVQAEGGVVLATGGFERDPELVRSFLRGPMTVPTGVEGLTGDGLKMAMRVGASLGTMREAWWVPVILVPDETGASTPALVLRERSLPRSIVVNRRGRRFVNEAANYNAFGGAFHVFDAGTFDYPNLPCWLVFDHEYLRLYGFAGSRPGAPAPPWVVSADTPAELAAAIGADPGGLAETVAAFNARSTSGPAIGAGAAVRGRSDRSTLRPTTRSSSTAAASARRVGPAPTSTPGCSTSTVRRSRASTRPGMRWPASRA